MPTYFRNAVRIDFDDDTTDEEIEAVRAKLGTEKLPFSFHHIMPEPEGLGGEASYRWCCDNWGTKWEPEGATVEKGFSTLWYGFNCPWRPPMGIIKRMIRDILPDSATMFWTGVSQDGAPAILLVKSAGRNDFHEYNFNTEGGAFNAAAEAINCAMGLMYQDQSPIKIPTT